MSQSNQTNDLTPDQNEAYNKILDRFRDEFKYSVYKCSCGARLFGSPASYHVIMLHHTQEREKFPWEKEVPKQLDLLL